MRIFLTFLLLVPVGLIRVQSQEPAETPPDIEVREFSSSKFRTYEPINHMRANSNKADTRSRAIIYQDEIRNRNSIENRSRDMLELEESVMRDSRNAKPMDLFRYRVSLKNSGLKTVNLVIWEYQASNTDDFTEASIRLFRCTPTIKPNESERLEGFSVFPPIRVINAARTAKAFNQRVVINRIEYSDGSSWQRSAWSLPEITLTQGGKGHCELLQ